MVTSIYSDSYFLVNFSFNALTHNFSTESGILIALLLIFAGLFNLFFCSTNLLLTLLFAELMFVGFFVGFVSVAVALGDASGLGCSLYLLCSAAVDSAIGLILTLNTYRLRSSVAFSRLTTLRG